MNTYVIVELIRLKTRTRIHLFWLYYSSDDDTIREDFEQEVNSMGPDWDGEMHFVPQDTFNALMMEKNLCL